MGGRIKSASYYASFGIFVLSLPISSASYFNDFLFEDEPCVEKKTEFDYDVLVECAALNTGGYPFGEAEKRLQFLEMCPGQEQYLDDLKLSITNKLFGGEGADGKLTKRDCEASCVYSMMNEGLEGDVERTVSGMELGDEYQAYHWNSENSCWGRVSADWCLDEVELPQHFERTPGEALTWRFPAFKVKKFCKPEELESIPAPGSPTLNPVQAPESNPLEAAFGIPEGCVVQDGYDCPHRFLLGFCDMSAAVRDSFVAQCPNCCVTAEESADAPVPDKFSTGAAPSSEDAGTDAAAAP